MWELEQAAEAGFAETDLFDDAVNEKARLDAVTSEVENKTRTRRQEISKINADVMNAKKRLHNLDRKHKRQHSESKELSLDEQITELMQRTEKLGFEVGKLETEMKQAREVLEKKSKKKNKNGRSRKKNN